MSGKKEVMRPVDAYKSIIDQLVAETSHGVSERLVKDEGIFSKALDERELNSLIQELSGEQRVTLAKMLHSERVAAIHDVLAVLSWWVDASDLGFTFRGESMPVDLSGMGLHGDYIGRQNAWEWPSDEGSGGA